jgi:hypothetical protein
VKRIITNLAPDLGAPGRHDFAVRIRAARRSAHPRPPHPRLTFVTFAIAPLAEAGRRKYCCFSELFKRNLFAPTS